MLASTWLLSLAIVWADPPPKAAAPLPTPDEVVNGYLANFERFKTLRIKSNQSRRHLDTWVVVQNRAIEALQARLEQAEPGKPEHERLQKQLEGLRQGLAQYKMPSASDQLFLSRRPAFQIRDQVVPYSSQPTEGDWNVPGDEPYRPSLELAAQGNLNAISYNGNRDDGIRYWMMQGPPYRGGYGQIMGTLNLGLETRFPPLAFKTTDLAVEFLLNPVDRFFIDARPVLKVVGRGSIDGHETVVVERPAPQWRMSRRAGLTAEAAATTARVDRADLDPAMGWLPRRIERVPAPSPPGTKPDEPGSIPPREVLEGVEIVAIDGAGFYPKKGVWRVYERPPATGEKPDESAPFVPVEETSWVALKIEGNLAIREDFQMPFPKGANYYDTRTGKNLVVGQEAFSGNRLPWYLCGGILAGWAAFGLFMAVRAAFRKRRRLRRAGLHSIVRNPATIREPVARSDFER